MTAINWDDERFAFEDYTADEIADGPKLGKWTKPKKKAEPVTTNEERIAFDIFFKEVTRIAIAKAGDSHLRGGGIHSYQPPIRREEWQKFRAVWNG